jgi:predicted 3-demethylubiquinone-9 3-methyltransferase (glyoxalase superfamily)
MQKVTTWLWFDNQGEEAAEFYTSLIPNSRVTGKTHYGEAGPGAPGSVMTVAFELGGVGYVALNGGPVDFAFNESISLEVACDSQDEVDELWKRLSEGGEEGPCGWLKDRYGLSWQIVPTRLMELLTDPDPAISQRTMNAMSTMKKIDIADLERAAANG